MEVHYFHKSKRIFYKSYLTAPLKSYEADNSAEPFIYFCS